MYKISVCTSQETHYVSTTKINQLMLLGNKCRLQWAPYETQMHCVSRMQFSMLQQVVHIEPPDFKRLSAVLFQPVCAATHITKNESTSRYVLKKKSSNCVMLWSIVMLHDILTDENNQCYFVFTTHLTSFGGGGVAAKNGFLLWWLLFAFRVVMIDLSFIICYCIFKEVLICFSTLKLG
jgi:hypothetical protein